MSMDKMAPIGSLAGAFSVSIAAVAAWTFPPVAIGPEVQLDGQRRLSALSDDDIDIVTGSRFHGLKTFANLPYVFCFSEKEDVEKYDIAILGAPFDTVCHDQTDIIAV
jgi:hypothetical protein